VHPLERFDLVSSRSLPVSIFGVSSLRFREVFVEAPSTSVSELTEDETIYATMKTMHANFGTIGGAIGVRLRHGWVSLGDYFDRWYEELPWRRSVPLGRRGEEIAARHLRRCGYRILERNFCAAGAEIDLIATDHETYVFVEVKARSSAIFGMPAEAVDARKAERIRRAANLENRQG
jgi:Holliday junction resolvase-like predicted endonuclease